MLRVDESSDPDAKRPDWLGFITFSTALCALVFGLIRANVDGWGSTTVAGSLGASAFLLLAFVVVELRQRRPMFDFRLLRVPTLQRRPRRGVGDLGVAVRADHLSHPLPAEHPRPLRIAGRRAVPPADRRDLPDRRRSPAGSPPGCRYARSSRPASSWSASGC